MSQKQKSSSQSNDQATINELREFLRFRAEEVNYLVNYIKVLLRSGDYPDFHQKMKEEVPKRYLWHLSKGLDVDLPSLPKDSKA